MKISILLLTIMLLLYGQIVSQTLHVFLFCKTSDPNIGNSVKINYGNMQDAFQVVATGLNYTYKEHALISGNFNIINVQRVLDTTTIKNDDMVFIYFSTHGAKSKWDSNIFPQIDIPDTLLAVYKIYNKMLTDKHPKSIITVIEACSGFLDITPQQSFIYQTASTEKKIQINTTQQKQNIQKLFSSNCNIIITAGEPGKNTWATWQGSMFTNCFLRTLKEFSESPNISMVSWDNFLQQCKQYTFDMTSSTSITYYPVWEKTNCNNVHTISDDSTISTSEIDTISISNKIRLSIETSQAQKGNNPYFVQLKIEGDQSEINSISKVQYYLDATMPKPIITNTKKSKNYSYGFSVWGEFPIKAKVYFSNGKVVDLYGEIKLDNINKN